MSAWWILVAFIVGVLVPCVAFLLFMQAGNWWTPWWWR